MSVESYVLTSLLIRIGFYVSLCESMISGPSLDYDYTMNESSNFTYDSNGPLIHCNFL